MNITRTAAEYRSASVRLRERAAGATQAGSHDAFADLAVIYEALAAQGEAAEHAAATAPKGLPRRVTALRPATRAPLRASRAVPIGSHPATRPPPGSSEIVSKRPVKVVVVILLDPALWKRGARLGAGLGRPQDTPWGHSEGPVETEAPGA
jgi:hypothetical protein